MDRDHPGWTPSPAERNSQLAQIRRTGGKSHTDTWAHFLAYHPSFAAGTTALFIAEHAPTGEERPATILQRVNQSYFRNSLLQNYHGTCCITGMQIQPLIASHIQTLEGIDAQRECRINGWPPMPP